METRPVKRFVVLSAGALALLAGNVFADGGCRYAQQAAMASAHDAVEEPRADEALSPELLAALRKQEREDLERALVVPNVPN